MVTFRPPQFPGNTFVRGMSRLSFDSYINPLAGSDTAAEIRRSNMVANLTTRNCKFIFVTDHCRRDDALVTGVPLVGRSALLHNRLPFQAHDSQDGRLSMAVYDPLSSELWRAVNQCDAVDRSICLAILPFIIPNYAKLAYRPYIDYSMWTNEVIQWHPSATVVTLGRRASDVLNFLGIPHQSVLPKNVTGVPIIDQLVDILLPPTP